MSPIELIFMMVVLTLLVVGPILLVVGGVAAANDAARRRQILSKAWMDLATRHGLAAGPTVMGGLPVLVGTVGGHQVELQTVRRGSAKSKRTYTVVQTRLSIPVPAGLKVTRDTFLGGLLTGMGGQDIPLADPRLDQNLKVQGHHPQAVRDLLDIGVVRQAMQRFFAHGRFTRLEGAEVIAERPGVQTGAAADAMLASAIALVTVMSEGRESAWHDLAKRHGLSRSGDAGVRLSGEREGVAVYVESTGGKTLITVAVRGLDTRLRIRAGGGGFVEQDQILGSRVCITGDASALGRQFGSAQLDVLRGDLMQVFKTWPETELRDGRLGVAVPGEPFRQLDAMLVDYQSLAEALRRTVSSG